MPEEIALPELSRRRRHLVLAICCLSLFIVGMDVTIINVAVPAIGRDFHAPSPACSGRSTRTCW
ncbi:MAG TPA: hypothetical protein VFE26_02765 [Trebonia sp.]|nr:hypothetical protein [Trebonia sp.]